MNKRIFSLVLAMSLCLGTAVAANVDSAFAARQQLVGFSLSAQGLNAQERQALRFIYAYSPLADVTGYDESYFVANIRQTLATRQTMPWGSQIPDNIFMHFVLPLRVNNEALDDFRTQCAPELMRRVQGMTMQQAILEVNHWCHERVTYEPSDARTSPPLSTIRTATGRCGEESTLTVAALRAVGIPARQVYTPRWAHTDDNHAWVEAWADGRWWFLGACEPEPVLNLGWFNAPASRAMLMHTRVFGDYSGPEETVLRTNDYTEVNLVGNYATTAKCNFQIVDTKGCAVPNSKVEFKIYNYAEFYSAVTKYADRNGRTSLTAGLGDMLVWASDAQGNHGHAKVSFGHDRQVTIVLNNAPLPQHLQITPPAEHARIPDVPPALAAANKVRLAREDSMRAAYTATFITDDGALPYLKKSRGNHATISDFLKKYASEQERAYKLLDGLTDKDLRDVTMAVLDDNMTASSSQLSPRVEDEPLVPYKHFLEQAFASQAQAFKANPQLLVKWCTDSLCLNPDKRALRYAQSPVGTYRYRITDERSRDIFFVSAARSFDIDARKDVVTGKVQYRMSPTAPWIDVRWTTSAAPKAAPQGKLVLTYETNGIVDNPKYYTHFTISRLVDGSPVLLNYDENGVDWQSTFKNGAALDTGLYLLVSGTRLATGGVLVATREFSISEGHTTTLPLELRCEQGQVMVMGNFNSESRIGVPGRPKPASILSLTGRGYYVLGIVKSGQEPTNHALRDMAKAMPERPVVLLFEDSAEAAQFSPAHFGLPGSVIVGTDPDSSILKALSGELKLSTRQLPIFVIADTFNRIVFASQGYTIGLGEQIKTTLTKIKQ